MNTLMQIMIDSSIKAEASALFESIGVDMSSAINFFLYQCVMNGGLPFDSNFNQETIKAMVEAKDISNDPSNKGYSSAQEALNALKED